MTEKVFQTPCGDIRYWMTERRFPDKPVLIFLPGLTADHRLFDKQIEYFQEHFDLFVWDAPGHNLSRPFRLEFSLMDKAKWLHDILQCESITYFILIGQSMGGYVSQAFIQQFPHEASGFLSIDSAPLQLCYVTGWELWLLKRMTPVYRHYPWKWLLRDGSKGVAVTKYGQKLMYDMMLVYDNNQEYYAQLSGHGFKILAEAMEANLPYEIDCPALLICGRQDAAGSAKSYNRRWHKKTGIQLIWLDSAGHNSNTDQPDKMNKIIENFILHLNQ